jgi:hypothetical protein
MKLSEQATAMLERIEEYRMAVHKVATTKLEAIPLAFGELQEAEYALNRSVRMFRESYQNVSLLDGA